VELTQNHSQKLSSKNLRFERRNCLIEILQNLLTSCTCDNCMTLQDLYEVLSAIHLIVSLILTV